MFDEVIVELSKYLEFLADSTPSHSCWIAAVTHWPRVRGIRNGLGQEDSRGGAEERGTTAPDAIVGHLIVLLPLMML